MGEEVDLSTFSPVDESATKKIDEAIIAEASEMLKDGRQRDAVKDGLRSRGYTFEDSEKIVSTAEARNHPRKVLGVSPTKVFLAVVGVVIVLAVASLAAFNLATNPVDCGYDSFCAEKVIACQPGYFSSSFRGITNEYTIELQDSYCRVFVKNMASTEPKVRPGMTMNCLYAMKDGQSDMGAGYAACDGSLALALAG